MSQDLWGHGWRIAALSDDEIFNYTNGDCGTWAVGHQRANPHLRFGIEWGAIDANHPDWEDIVDDNELDPDDTDQVFWQPQHIFTHDDTHAYDARGAHPLPAMKSMSSWDDVTLNHSPQEIAGLGVDDVAGKHPHPDAAYMVNWDRVPNPDWFEQHGPQPHTATRLAMPYPFLPPDSYHWDHDWSQAEQSSLPVSELHHRQYPDTRRPQGRFNIEKMPPIKVLFHNELYWIMDGHHRADWAAGKGITHIPALILNNQQQKEARIMSAAVTVYTQPNCIQCTMTKKQLDKLGIEHDTVDVSSDPEAHKYVTGLGYTAAPVVVVNGGETHWSGFKPDRLKELSGE